MELELLKWLVLSLIGVGVYFLKRTVDQIDKQQVKLEATLVAQQLAIQNVRDEYLPKNDFKEFKVELRNMFADLKQDIHTLREK